MKFPCLLIFASFRLLFYLISSQKFPFQEQLNSNLERLHNERGFQERVATSITDQMQIETQVGHYRKTTF